jgi:hypothetical protein
MSDGTLRKIESGGVGIEFNWRSAMSVHSVEKVLWEVCNSPERAAQYLSDPETLLGAYRLSDEERRMVRVLDVRALTNHNVNPMLIMMTHHVAFGSEKAGEYVQKLNGAQQSA